MHAALPELDGIEATRRIRAHDPEIRVILLSDDADDHEQGLDALRAGAIGFLPRRIALDALPRVLRAAMAGEARDLTPPGDGAGRVPPAAAARRRRAAPRPLRAHRP